MPIDTENEYDARLAHPLYVKITKPNQNSYKLWEEYEIRVPDEKRDDDGPYNYAFETILVGKEVAAWENIPGLLKAYAADTRDAQEAMLRIYPGPDSEFPDPDEELAVLFFLRIDQTKEFITSDHDKLVAQMGEVE